MKKEKKKKAAGQQWIAFLIFLLIGAASGVLISQYLDHFIGRDTTTGMMLLIFGLLLFAVYVGMLIQIVIHEAGHLIFGLMTGYEFISFRIFSWMWVKEEDKICFRRMSLAGTGGQCLMSPPELIDGKIPVLLYNFGGAILNLITGLLFLALSFLFPAASFFSAFLRILAVIGAGFAFANGVPLRLGNVDNDGRNAFSLMRDSEAVRAFWIQLRVNEQISKGIRLKNMPEEWFVIPEDTSMRNSLTAVVGVLAANRLMDMHRFEEAYDLMDHLLTIESGIIGLHRGLMTCDCLYVECIGRNRPEKLQEMLTKEQRKQMKTMRKYPSVVRTEYAMALLAERDDKKALKIARDFDRCAEVYPYPGEIAGERELMEIARNQNERKSVG